jgi:iron complex transport system substrate-binding protein
MTMKIERAVARILLGLLCACGWSAPAQERTLTDMAGRKVKVPQHIRKVYCMSPVCTVLVYTLAPELLAGWNYQPEPGEMKWIVEPYRKLAALGGWFGKNNTGNLEEIVKAHPDVLMSVGDPLALSIAERVQEQTHLPVFVGDGSLKNLDKLYLAAGELLGRQARAAELADYCRKVVHEVAEKVAAIPPARRRRVYYAEGPTGLETEAHGSAHSETIDFVGGLNVAEVPAESGYGHIQVSMEQVLKWDPEIVIAGYDHSSSPGEFYRTVFQDPIWQHVKAVRNRAVYETPQYPFNWIDRPPSANRIIGIKWLANLFYPDVFHYDIRAETSDFYQRFYHRKPSDTELAELLAQAVGKP